MTKQYFSTLLKRVGISSFIGVVVLLMIACPPDLSDSVKTTDSSGAATAPAKPVLNEPSDTDNTKFTITWADTGVTDAKKKDGKALEAGDVAYAIYYASSTTALADADAVKDAATKADANPATVGVKTVEKGVLTTTVIDKAFVGTVYMVLEAINSTDTSKVSPLSNVKTYNFKATVVSKATAPTKPVLSSPNDTDNTKFTIRWESPFELGNKANGKELTIGDVDYKLYYASSTTTLADAAAVKKVATKADANPKTTGVEVVSDGRGKTTVTNKAFVGTVYIVLEAINSTDTSKVSPLSNVQTYNFTATVGTGSRPAIALDNTGLKPGSVKLTLTLPGGDEATGERYGKDSKDDAVTAASVGYWLYYLKTDKDIGDYTPFIDALEGKVSVNRGGTPVIRATSIEGGEEKGIIALSNLETTTITGLTAGKQYYFFVRVVRSDGEYVVGTGTSGKYTRDSLIRFITANTAIAKPGPATRPHMKQIRKDSFEVNGLPPRNRGTKADGTDVGEEEIKYEVYYARVTHTANGVTVSTTTSAVDVVTAVGTTTNNEHVGKREITGNTALDKYVLLDGLKKGAIGTKYRCVIRAIHPDDPTLFADLVDTKETTPTDTTPPIITSWAFTSDPKKDRTYYLDEVIQVTVTFSEPVWVDTILYDGTRIPQRVPHVLLSINDKHSKKHAKYVGKINHEAVVSNTLVFEYKVRLGDHALYGIGLRGDNNLELNDSEIRDEAGMGLEYKGGLSDKYADVPYDKNNPRNIRHKVHSGSNKDTGTGHKIK